MIIIFNDMVKEITLLESFLIGAILTYLGYRILRKANEIYINDKIDRLPKNE